MFMILRIVVSHEMFKQERDIKTSFSQSTNMWINGPDAVCFGLNQLPWFKLVGVKLNPAFCSILEICCLTLLCC